MVNVSEPNSRTRRDGPKGPKSAYKGQGYVGISHKTKQIFYTINNQSLINLISFKINAKDKADP